MRKKNLERSNTMARSNMEYKSLHTPSLFIKKTHEIPSCTIINDLLRSNVTCLSMSEFVILLTHSRLYNNFFSTSSNEWNEKKNGHIYGIWKIMKNINKIRKASHLKFYWSSLRYCNSIGLQRNQTVVLGRYILVELLAIAPNPNGHGHLLST